MKNDYKSEFFSRYVSTHDAHMYRPMTEDAARSHFFAFQKHFGGFLPERKDARILDCGCGGGTLLYWLEQSGFTDVEGVDVSPEQVQVAQSLGVKKVFCEDFRVFLSRSKTKYDIVFLRDVLGHFRKEEVIDVVDLIYKNLNDGGIFVVKTRNAESPMSGQLRYGDITHDVSFTRTSLEQVLAVAGFKKVEVYSMPPVVHGIKSALRFVFWKCIECGLRFYRMVDSGSGEGIFTQNVMAVAYK